MITQTIKKIPEYIDHIIAVNDASTDNTIGVLNKLKKQYSKLIIVDNKVNQGVGGALIAGYDYAIKNTKATAISRLRKSKQVFPSRSLQNYAKISPIWKYIHISTHQIFYWVLFYYRHHQRVWLATS